MTEAVELAYPFTGRWLVQNSPANRVPSHGTHLFATSHAIDFVPVDSAGRSAPLTVRSLLRAEPPQHFTGFGRPILAPGSGRVVAAHDGEPDHHAVRGFPSVGYALTQPRRAAGGWPDLAGNHVVIEIASDVLVALCHLQADSVSVAAGQDVETGTQVGRCGNSGNSTQPHVHLQAMDRLDPRSAMALPIRFPDGLPHNREVVTA
ncbi:MAG: M23 family metallopeptidase [Intrasporangium sp.]|uniref:M23 family metallopeptidase n=1 Tax=Intrasporangium sp. TaxID=1925024 RepID=UPI0026476C65|nr:M23 family metallopeptidase [Intrasporangium sp.]MDN5796477.1 M23 family metallopeptidase [Intrasporangium sp.]